MVTGSETKNEKKKWHIYILQQHSVPKSVDIFGYNGFAEINILLIFQLVYMTISSLRWFFFPNVCFNH